MKKLIGLGVTTATILLLVLGLALVSQSPVPASAQSGGGQVIATVQGEPIDEEEFEIFVTNNSGKAHQLLQTAKPNYTDADYNRKVRQLAWEDALRAKAYQLLGKENGLLEDASYAAFQKERKEENLLRKKTKEEGGVVYGLLEYDTASYQAYRQSNLVLDLKSELAKTKTTVTDQEVQEYFENLSEHEEIPTIYTAKVLTFPYDATPENYEKSRDKALELCEEAYQKICAGSSLDDIKNNYPQAVLETNEYSTSTKANELQLKKNIYQALYQTAVGGISTPLEGNGGFSILQVLNLREELGKEFEDMDSRIRIKLESEKFDRYFEEYLQSLTVEILDPVLKKVLDING